MRFTPGQNSDAGLSFWQKGAGFIKLFIGLVLCSQLCLSYNAQGEVIEQIAAVVNGEVITETELEEALIPLQSQYSQTIRSKGKLKQKMREARQLTLEQLIETKLLLQKAKEEKIGVPDDEAEKMLSEIKGKIPDPEKFQEWLRIQKLTLTGLKKRLKEQGLIRKLINKKLKPGIKVSPEEIKAFYEKHRDKFLEGPQVNLSYILVKGPPEREDPEAEALMRRIWEKLEEGVDFNLLVQEYSDGPKIFNGGNAGFIGIQKLPPELREIVEKLKVGETSEIIRTPEGFNILKLTGRKEAKSGELSEVEEIIEEQIFRKKLEEKYQIWLEELKEEAYVERK